MLLREKNIKIREKIEQELETLDLEGLSILYTQIKLIKKKKHLSKKPFHYTIEEIQQLTSSSRSSWSKAVSIDREERL